MYRVNPVTGLSASFFRSGLLSICARNVACTPPSGSRSTWPVCSALSLASGSLLTVSVILSTLGDRILSESCDQFELRTNEIDLPTEYASTLNGPVDCTDSV